MHLSLDPLCVNQCCEEGVLMSGDMFCAVIVVFDVIIIDAAVH